MFPKSSRIPRALLICAVGFKLVHGSQMLWAQEQAETDRTVVEIAGDVLPESSWKGVQDAAHIFDGVRDEFAGADLVFLNLEEPITSSNTVTPNKNQREVKAGRDYILRARNPDIPDILKQAGVGLVGLANNHMMDYTTVGLRDTLRVFQQADFPVVGAGLKPDAESAFLFSARGVSMAFLAFTDVVPPNYEATTARLGVASSKDENDLIEAVKRARIQADFVILIIHWGGQGGHLITPRQRELARIAVQAGCDAVIGMHPHVLQGIEFVGGVPVFYSIGNFAFPSGNPAARESVALELIFGSHGLDQVKIIPAEISTEGAPKISEGSDGQEILLHLDHFCRMFNAMVEGGMLIHGPVRQRLVYDMSAGQPRRRALRKPGRRGRARPNHKKRAGGLARQDARELVLRELGTKNSYKTLAILVPNQ